jgi:hypothetical protein
MAKKKEPEEPKGPQIVGRRRTCAWCGSHSIKMMENWETTMTYRCVSCRGTSTWHKDTHQMVRKDPSDPVTVPVLDES